MLLYKKVYSYHVNICCVFPWQSFKTQSTFYKMHCALFEEDNGKQRRQFRLRFEYSNVEQCSSTFFVTVHP